MEVRVCRYLSLAYVEHLGHPTMSWGLHDGRPEYLPFLFLVPVVPEHARHVEHCHRIIGIEDKRLAIGGDRFVSPAQMMERRRILKSAHSSMLTVDGHHRW